MAKRSAMYVTRTVCALCFSSLTLDLRAALQPVSEAPLAGQYQQSCRLHRNGSAECISEQRITVLKPAGRALVSKFEYSYPNTDRFEVLKTEIIDPNGKKTPLPKSNLETREAPQPAQGFARDKQTSFFFPKIEVGSVIFYKVRQYYAAKPLINQVFWTQSILAHPIRYDRYTLSFVSDRPLVWRGEALDDFTVTHSADKKQLNVEQKAPRYVYYVNEPEGSAIRRSPRVSVGVSDNVQDHLGTLVHRYNRILEAPLPAAAAAVVRAVKGKSPSERVAGLMEHIYTRYRYLGDWRPSTRGYLPFNLAEIEKHGYGDCKDLSVLLTAMLRSANIQAEPAFVHRGQFASPLLLPVPSDANHAIVRAQVGNQIWWLDPTNSAFIQNYIMPDVQDRWAWVIHSNGRVQQTHIPAEPPEKDISSGRKLVHFKSDGSADLQRQTDPGVGGTFWLSILDQQQGVQSTNQFLCEQVGNEPADCDIKRPATTFQVPVKYPITATALDNQAAEKVSGQFVYEEKKNVLSTFSEVFRIYLRDQALSDLYLGNTQVIERHVRLKNAWPKQKLQPCRVRSQWFDIDLEWQPENDGIAYRYRQVQKFSWLSHDEIISAAFKGMYDQMRQCVKQMRFAVRLTKDQK